MPQPTPEQRLQLRERPPCRPVMYQSWQELLFLHWRIDTDIIQRTLPAGLHVDTCDGAAWLGVVPFLMRNIRPWWFCSVPGISNFLELNLRTYVCDDAGRPGVWFYSLDASQPLAVWAARTFFHLPY
ncbi:MAG: YqjF family protein, partial [Maioricimonas sp. JB045]